MTKHISEETRQGTIFLIVSTAVTIVAALLAMYIAIYGELPNKEAVIVGLLVTFVLWFLVVCSTPRLGVAPHLNPTKEKVARSAPKKNIDITEAPPATQVISTAPLRETPLERAWKKYNRTYHRLLVYLATPPTGYTVILPWYVIPTLKEFDREGQQIRAMCNELGPTHEGRMEELYTLLCRTASVHA
jgi:hypothetical protein